MKIVLSNHLKIRLKQRKIPQDYPKRILKQSDDNFLDSETGHKIAIKKLRYGGKLRPMVVAYDKIVSEIQVITVYPTTELEIGNRAKSGRWIKDEKN